MTIKELLGNVLNATDDDTLFFYIKNGFVTRGPIEYRNEHFDVTDLEDALAKIEKAVDSGENVFVSVPEKDGSITEFKLETPDGEPKLFKMVPQDTVLAVTVAMRNSNASLNSAGDKDYDTPEFKDFRASLNNLVDKGIPATELAFHDALLDTVVKSFLFTVDMLDKDMNPRQNACFTEAAKIQEIYNSIYYKRKPSVDVLNLSIIAAKYLKISLIKNISGADPKIAENSKKMLSDYYLFLIGIYKVMENKGFKAMLKGYTKEQVHDFAHINAQEIYEAIQENLSPIENYAND